MNRTSAAAVAAAAVFGVVGGASAATLGIDLGDDGQRTSDRPTTRSPEPSPTRSTTAPAPSSPAQLLYMDSGTIHDGYTRVAVDDVDIKNVRELVRISGGWLVVLGAPAETALRGVVVAANGDQTELDAFDGHWDINENGTLFVASHEDGYRVTNLMEDTVVDVDISGPPGSTTSATAAFTGTAVLTGWTSTSGDLTTRRTDLPRAGPGPSRPVTSPAGPPLPAGC